MLGSDEPLILRGRISAVVDTMAGWAPLVFDSDPAFCARSFARADSRREQRDGEPPRS